MPDHLPADLRQFIAAHIASLAQLETLLSFRRETDRTWTAGDFARVLYVPPEVSAGILSDLERRGFIEPAPAADGSFKYRPGGDEVDQLIEQLGALYQERRVAVITEIYSKPTNPAQLLADAFRLRKET